MGTGSYLGGKERSGRDADPSPPSSAVGHEGVELYLYSPYGPYGLYRASVPVQGRTLPLLFIIIGCGRMLAFIDFEFGCLIFFFVLNAVPEWFIHYLQPVH